MNNFQFLSSFIAIAIPMLFIVFMLENKSSRQIIMFFCWGIFAGILAFNLNNLLGTTREQADRMTVSIAPMIEEVCKGLPLLFIVMRKKLSYNNKQIVFCGLASGIGFSVQESMYFFTISSREIIDVLMLIVRVLTTSLMHGMVTAAFGIGLMLLHKQRSMLIPVIFGLFALCASVHSLFNLLMHTWMAWLSMLMPISMLFAGWVFIRNYNPQRKSHINAPHGRTEVQD
jgi:RsiW-degrading membrane proteinase PrsW (M82 family)